MTTNAANDVVIAGAGVAAAVTACELRRRGFRVWMIATPGVPASMGIEAVPGPAAVSLDEIGLGDVLARAGAVAVDGFDNAWSDPARPMRVRGRWHHVERQALARALFDTAIERGAHVVELPRVPRLHCDDATGAFGWADAALPSVARIAIDATGRAAVWSRPIVRHDAKRATLFRGPGSAAHHRGRVAQTPTGWAYALCHPQATTVGVIMASQRAHRTAQIAAIPGDVAAVLGLECPEAFRRERACVAHTQWAERPVSASASSARLSVGDAAFACEPVAGQGIRFAIASAVAAVACCVTQRETADDRSPVFQFATQYYDEFVASARRRHVSQLGHLASDSRSAAGLRLADDMPLQFSAPIVPTGIRRGAQIVPGTAIRLGDGELARWLGAFDLLDLEVLTRQPRTARDLERALSMSGMSSLGARQLVQWCVKRGVLAPV